VRCDVTVLPVIVIRAIKFAGRSDRNAILNKQEWSGAGQDFDGKLARHFRIWNVHGSNRIHKVSLYAQRPEFVLQSQGLQYTAIHGRDAVCWHPSRSTERTSIFASLSHV
jgi:hypothetical protein